MWALLGIWSIQESINRNNEDCLRQELKLILSLIKTKCSFLQLCISRYGPGGDEEPPNDHDFYQNCKIVPDLQVDYKWGRKVFQISILCFLRWTQVSMCHVPCKCYRTATPPPTQTGRRGCPLLAWAMMTSWSILPGSLTSLRARCLLNNDVMRLRPVNIFYLR